MSLDSYREAAEARAQKRFDERIFNGSLEHANILVETMIKYALPTEDLYIYSGSLPQETFENIKTTKAKSIHILVDDDTNIGWVKELGDTRITIKKIAKARPNHFLCTSGGFFRFETDTQNYQAEANFNEPLVVNTLVGAFNRYSEGASAVA